jgi:hypothetical protein
VDALVQALADLDRPRLSSLTDGARAGRHRFSWDGYAAALEQLIEDAMKIRNSKFEIRNRSSALS